MKIALLADIHGNADALAAVLAAAQEAGAERLLLAGDFVGYYYEPDRVMALLSAWPHDSVRGNHEDMLRTWRDGGNQAEIRTQYGSGLAAAVDGLTATQLEMLVGLPARQEMRFEGRRVLLCHGSPWDGDAYVYPTAAEADRARMMEPGFDLVVFGHTHYPVMWHAASGATVVNPGSVGQPRNRQPGAQWALWDCTSGIIELRSETYDMTSLVAECRWRDPHLPYLVNVLLRR
jgi:putative phosphoesterase